VSPQGAVLSSTSDAPPLPAGAAQSTTPESVAIGGGEFLVAGTSVGTTRIVAGESVASVGRAVGTIVIAELAIGPVLLVVVFAGALAVGRRVAGPIERAHKRQLDFTADASHELRTPLSVIEAETSLALTNRGGASADEAALRRVLEESRRMHRMVDDMLWLARLEATPTSPSHETVDLVASVATAAQRFRSLAQRRGLHLDVDSDTATPVLIEAPPEWVDRLVGVLLDNACKYAPAGGHVRVSAVVNSDRARLAVDDSGPGIDPAHRSRIFDRFHREIGDAGGAGLGLAIGDAVVAATRGRWEIGDSDLGGASVAVVWPLVGARLHNGGQPKR
ncbi:MAG: hypothetical protein JOY80_05890, partial [Candidatus Dormibacteraeota bacterium]|nr:hypothetical protein [Candidatus Dormibacteraeota bacterium]